MRARSSPSCFSAASRLKAIQAGREVALRLLPDLKAKIVASMR